MRSSRCARTTVFTTHTPVPAGNEIFGEELVRALRGGLAAAAGIGHDELLDLGRFGDDGGFGLTPFALRLSDYANGVSELHGEVAREMWARSGRTPTSRRSGTSRTASTWAPGSTPGLPRSSRDAGVRPDAPPHEAGWEAVRDLNGDDLWRVHAACKARLADRGRLRPRAR